MSVWTHVHMSVSFSHQVEPRNGIWSSDLAARTFTHWAISPAHFFLFFETGCLAALGAHYLAGQEARETTCLHPSCSAEVTGWLPHTILTWVLSIQTRGLSFVRRTLYRLSISPTPPSHGLFLSHPGLPAQSWIQRGV